MKRAPTRQSALSATQPALPAILRLNATHVQSGNTEVSTPMSANRVGTTAIPVTPLLCCACHAMRPSITESSTQPLANVSLLLVTTSPMLLCQDNALKGVNCAHQAPTVRPVLSGIITTRPVCGARSAPTTAIIAMLLAIVSLATPPRISENLTAQDAHPKLDISKT